ncbi:hypothetical protein IAU60_002893 [Kwoniella sp. DSM 27419]
MTASSSMLARSAYSPSFARRLAVARRRIPQARADLHTTSSALAQTASSPQVSLIPPATALSALLSRLSLPASSTLHPSLVACLTHPSYFVARQAAEEEGSLPELEVVGEESSQTRETNELLSTLGNSLLGLFASEHLSTLYPLLPTTALQSAITAYVGPSSCLSVARELGVSVQGGGNTGLAGHGAGAKSAGLPVRWSRTAVMEKNWEERRGLNVDTAFPEKVPVGRRFEKFVKKASPNEAQHDGQPQGSYRREKRRENFEDIVASTVRAFVGLIYQEQGIHAARAFVHAHFLSRALDLSTLFNFKNPLHVLTSVVASHLTSAGVPVSANQGVIEKRLLASTGVASQSPLFLVGLFLPSGIKLAEGHGSSKAMAEHRAAVNALLSLFLVRGDQEASKSLGVQGLVKKVGEHGQGLPSSVHAERLLSEGRIAAVGGAQEADYVGVAWGGKDVLAESGRRRRV